MARISPQEKARSDAYFEGGYVLQVVDLIYALVVAGLLLWLQISSRMRDIAASLTRHRWLQVPIYAVQYLVVVTVVTLPLTIYEEFFREHHYLLSNQTFGQWAAEIHDECVSLRTTVLPKSALGQRGSSAITRSNPNSVKTMA